MLNSQNYSQTEIENTKISKPILITNIAIFLLYTMIIVIMGYLELMASLYFVQVGILFIISFVLAIGGAIGKKKTSAKDYFLTAWWILIIGFTGWVIIIMSGFGW